MGTTQERWREARSLVFELQILIESLHHGIHWLGEDLRTSGLEGEFRTLSALATDALETVRSVSERLGEAPDNDN